MLAQKTAQVGLELDSAITGQCRRADLNAADWRIKSWFGDIEIRLVAWISTLIRSVRTV
jgi:hypothetical protein